MRSAIMSFSDLPPQSPYVSDGAKNYAKNINAWSREALARSRAVIDIPYGPEYYQKIDLYLPEDKSLSHLPVFLYLHGGGFRRGYKEEMGFMAPNIVSLPAIFLSVSYRLAPAVRYEQQVDDTISAIALVRAIAPQFGGDPNRLAIGGHSAGAHLSSMVTLRPDLLEKRGLPRDAVKYCFPVSGSFEFLPERDQADTAELLGDLALSKAWSPITHVGKSRTPFYITWGTRDLPGMLATSEPMIAALKANGTPVEHHVYEGADHFDTSLAHARADDVWVKALRQRLAAL
jgi:acetyl esterase/lipase